MTTSLEEACGEAAALLAASASPSVFTGAGMSRDSGLRTFRGADGWWRERRAEDLATLRALEREPVLVWEWYRDRLASLEGVEPHEGYRALARLEGRVGCLPVITQNVDGLHRAAGCRRVVELHGSVRTASCSLGCGFSRTLDTGLLADLPPRCPCGAVLRPDVVMFGEPLPAEALEEALAIASATDLMIVAGTSMAVFPAAGIPIAALSRGARIIEVNPEPTALNGRAGVIHIRAGAREALPRITGEA